MLQFCASAPGTFVSMIELTKGQDLPLEETEGRPLTRLRMGLGWAKHPTAGAIGTGAPEIDLDATAVQFAGGQLFDLAFYNNLRTRDGSVEHLGDNLTGRGEGDDEVLAVDLERVYSRVDRIVFLVSSYHGHSLEWVSRAYCRIVDAADPDQEVELARFRLSLEVRDTGVVMAAIVRTDAGWTLRTIGEGVPITVPTEGLDALKRFL